MREGVLLNLAILYEDRGQYDDADNCLERLLSVNPNHPRGRLYQKDVDSSLSMMYDEDSEKRAEKRNALLETPVTDFELSVRARNCLKKMNIRTLGDLLKITEAEAIEQLQGQPDSRFDVVITNPPFVKWDGLSPTIRPRSAACGTMSRG